MNKKDYITRTPEEFGKSLGLSNDTLVKSKIQVDLFIAIRRTIKKNKWTSEQVAKKAKISKAVVKAIISGDVNQTSTDQLIGIAYNLGLKVQLKVA